MKRLRLPRLPDAFELLIAWLCVASGLPLALGAPPPNSLQRILPSWLVHCWGATLFVGGLLIVVGIAVRHRRAPVPRYLLGLWVERAGLMPLAAGSAVFAVAIAAVGGWRGTFAAGTYIAFAAACLLRGAEIGDIERGLRGASAQKADGAR